MKQYRFIAQYNMGEVHCQGQKTPDSLNRFRDYQE